MRTCSMCMYVYICMCMYACVCILCVCMSSISASSTAVIYFGVRRHFSWTRQTYIFIRCRTSIRPKFFQQLRHCVVPIQRGEIWRCVVGEEKELVYVTRYIPKTYHSSRPKLFNFGIERCCVFSRAQISYFFRLVRSSLCGGTTLAKRRFLQPVLFENVSHE